MKNIIVPTDFSECAENALRVAAEIAKKNKSFIHLVHVYECPVYGFVDIYVDNDKDREIKNHINAEIKKLGEKSYLKGIKLKKLVLRDIDIWEMLNNAEIRDSDLVVMGSHGRKGLQGVLIGSNTDRVVRKAEIPVLVIKNRQDNFTVKDMVFASNFSSETSSVFAKIKKLALLFDATIHLVKICTRGDFEPTVKSNKSMQDLAYMFSLKKYTINVYNDETIEDGIVNFSRLINANLIAMETHGRTGLAHVINGSITEDVVSHTSRPVLSVKIKT